MIELRPGAYERLLRFREGRDELRLTDQFELLATDPVASTLRSRLSARCSKRSKEPRTLLRASQGEQVLLRQDVRARTTSCMPSSTRGSPSTYARLRFPGNRSQRPWSAQKRAFQ